MCEADRHTEISINRLYFGYHCRLTSPLLISISVLFSPTFSWPPVVSLPFSSSPPKPFRNKAPCCTPPAYLS